MKSDDVTAAAFDRRLEEVMAAYIRERPSDAALRAWWAVLEPFAWEVVEPALLAHVADCKFPPTPADIFERLVTQDGRPTPAEAWSVALQAADEAATVVWTAEIAEAWAVAKPVLDAGDKVGARQAFVAAYEQRVAEARRRLRTTEWRVSLGQDPQRRTDALLAAQRQGLLPPQTVGRLLPAPVAGADADAGAGGLDEAAASAQAAALLAGNVIAFPMRDERNRRRFLAAVREGLARGEADKAAEQARRSATEAAQEAERERARAKRQVSREEHAAALQAELERRRRERAEDVDPDAGGSLSA
ncbi:hypothetical protein CKO31_18215 [Thiohalocapsa halophila]|uniref:Replicative helicase inhibitor G39P N-terminal domain-containing protein n=1 Tax=Thiohalocapsa halophila TaxID=69359 RepID=A0ABS1CL33_9GAMM|nr:hypothetical protein [Thiohalocapsa halophila]MBK1632641.1 hypothetical protein [Thiohalocapsa halophila]